MLLRRCACRHVADGQVAHSVAGGTGEKNLAGGRNYVVESCEVG
jgi:hypothetical protein